MGGWLKQSTAVTIKFGPFLDSTDGNTAETGLTLQKADVRLSKNGGNMAAANADQGASDAGAAHDELGYYDISLDTTDTGTLGRLKVMVHESGALAVWDEFMVVTANVYDTLCSTDQFDVNVTNIEGADPSDTINAACDTAMTDYDAATGTELAAVDGKIDTIDGNVDSILADTNELQTNQGDWATATGFSTHSAADVVDEWETQSQADPTGFHVNVLEIGGTAQTANDNGADINAILADTNELQTDDIPGTLTTIDSKIDTIDGIVDDILTDTGTTLQGELDGIQADTEDLQVQIGTAGDGLTALADMLWDEVMEGTETARQKMNLHSAVLLNKSSGGGTTTSTFRDAGDTKNRISATTDANGNRTAIGTRDGA